MLGCYEIRGTRAPSGVVFPGARAAGRYRQVPVMQTRLPQQLAEELQRDPAPVQVPSEQTPSEQVMVSQHCADEVQPPPRFMHRAVPEHVPELQVSSPQHCPEFVQAVPSRWQALTPMQTLFSLQVRVPQQSALEAQVRPSRRQVEPPPPPPPETGGGAGLSPPPPSSQETAKTSGSRRQAVRRRRRTTTL